MSIARGYAAAALIGQDAYVAGGWNSDSGRSSCLSSCERFRSGEWTAITSMNEKRCGLAMVAIDGKLLMFGGYNGSNYLSSVECYDVERDRWEIVSQMPTACMALATAQLNGSIYVCGGWGGHYALSVCEHYDQRRTEWVTVANTVFDQI